MRCIFFNIYFVLFIFLTFIIQACQKIDDKSIIIDFTNKEYIPINSWHIVGPYDYNLDSIDLKDYNYFSKPEETILESDFKLKIENDTVLGKNVVISSDSNFISLSKLSKAYNLSRDSSAIYYLYKKVYSKKKQSVAFKINIQSSYKIWINNKHEESNFSNSSSDNFINYQLNKGYNDILVKIYTPYQSSFRLNFLFHILKKSYAKRDHYYKFSHNFLSNCILENPDSIEIKTHFKFCGNHPELIIVNDKKEKVLCSSLNLDSISKVTISSLPKGLYTCHLKFIDNIYSQRFVYGNCDSIYNSLNNKLKKYKIKDEHVPQLNMLKKRISFLLDHKITLKTRKNFFKIAVSMDAITWDTIYSGYNRWANSKFISHKLNGEKAKYLRIIGLGNEHNEWNKINEVKLYGITSKRTKISQLSIQPITSSFVKNTNTEYRLTDDDIKTTHAFLGIGEYVDFKMEKPSFLEKIKLSFVRYKGTSKDIERWKSKITWPLYSLAELTNRIENGTSPYLLKSGINIKSYISEIDGQSHYYLVIAPNITDSEYTLPVGIRVATMQGQNFPFYHGWALSSTSIINKLELAAKEYNMLFVLTWSTSYRKSISSYLIANQEAILKHLQKDYNIDTSRIHIFGSCEGATKILQLAEYYPDRYASAAGIALTLINKKEHSDKLMIWNRIQNLKYTNLYFAHSNYDTHSPFSDLVDFSEYANKFQLPVNYDIHLGAKHSFYNYESYDEIADFYSKHIKEDKPKEIHLSTHALKYGKSYWVRLKSIDPIKGAKIDGEISWNTIKLQTKNVHVLDINLNELDYYRLLPLKVYVNDSLRYKGKPDSSYIPITINQPKSKLIKTQNIEGPIGHAFGSKFIIVQGTKGKGKIADKVKYTTSRLIKFWEDRYFTKCYSKKDIDIDKEDIYTSNLILIGDSTNNHLISKIQNQLPLKISKKGINLCSKNFEGDSIRMQMIYPNPLNSNKYIVLLTGNYLESYHLGHNPFEIHDHDYRIVKYLNGKAEEIEKGIFNEYWKIPAKK